MTPNQDDAKDFRSDVITAAIAVEFGAKHSDILAKLAIPRSEGTKPLYSTLASKTATEFDRLAATI